MTNTGNTGNIFDNKVVRTGVLTAVLAAAGAAIGGVLSCFGIPASAIVPGCAAAGGVIGCAGGTATVVGCRGNSNENSNANTTPPIIHQPKETGEDIIEAQRFQNTQAAAHQNDQLVPQRY